MDKASLASNIANALKDAGIVTSHDAAKQKAAVILGEPHIEVYGSNQEEENQEGGSALQIILDEETQNEDSDEEEEPQIVPYDDTEGASDTSLSQPESKPVPEQSEPSSQHVNAQRPQVLESGDDASQVVAGLHQQASSINTTPPEDAIPEESELTKSGLHSSNRGIIDVWSSEGDPDEVDAWDEEDDDFEEALRVQARNEEAAQEVAKPKPWTVPSTNEVKQRHMGEFKIGGEGSGYHVQQSKESSAQQPQSSQEAQSGEGTFELAEKPEPIMDDNPAAKLDAEDEEFKRFVFSDSPEEEE